MYWIVALSLYLPASFSVSVMLTFGIVFDCSQTRLRKIAVTDKHLVWHSVKGVKWWNVLLNIRELRCYIYIYIYIYIHTHVQYDDCKFTKHNITHTYFEELVMKFEKCISKILLKSTRKKLIIRKWSRSFPEHSLWRYPEIIW